MDTFKGQQNKEIKSLCLENNRESIIVPHNFTYKFQSLDLTINQKANKFVSDQFNGKSPEDVKVSLKLTDLKSLHAKWEFEMYEYFKEQKEPVVKGFEKAG